MTCAKTFFHGEVQLLNWSETHNGGAKIVLQLADPRDLDAFKLMTIKKGNIAGQRIAVAMVQINEHEMPEPVAQKLSVQSALMCKGASFQLFVERKQGFSHDEPVLREKQAADFVRQYCGVESRSELDRDGAAGMKYQRMLAEYRNFIEINT